MIFLADLCIYKELLSLRDSWMLRTEMIDFSPMGFVGGENFNIIFGCCSRNILQAWAALLVGVQLAFVPICSTKELVCWCTDGCDLVDSKCSINTNTGKCAVVWRRGFPTMQYICARHHQCKVKVLHARIECCSSHDLCNAKRTVEPPNPIVSVTAVTSVSPAPATVTTTKNGGKTDLYVAAPFGVCLAFSLIVMAVLCVYCFRSRRKASPSFFSLRGRQRSEALQTRGVEPFATLGLPARTAGNSSRSLAVIDEASVMTSGSGSGACYLVQRTLSREIELRTSIGKGRFGEVHSGVWQGEDVAVKIFYSRDEQSWVRETEIYTSVLLRHEFILTFYGSDVRSNKDWTELWLIAQYHPKGSLYDYLVGNVIDAATALKFTYSIASGLNHLHTEIQGTCGKRSIAHRDLKSRNILVKEDLNCCIADLGLAVIHDPESNEPPDVPYHKVGTKRYMSPEVLSESIDVRRFNAFRCVDIYAMGLVLWEIGRRCCVDDEVYSYEPPYYDRLLSDPSVEEVRQVVVVAKHRPKIPDYLLRDNIGSHLAHTMRDCWRENPASRVTALRVKKTFFDLKKKVNSLPTVDEVKQNEQRVKNTPTQTIELSATMASDEAVNVSARRSSTMECCETSQSN